MHVRVSAVFMLCLLACVDHGDDSTPITPAIAPSSGLVRHHADAIANRYIVVLDRTRTRSAQTIDQAIDHLATRHGARIEHRYTSVIEGFAAEMSPSEAAALAADPNVAYVEENTPVYASTTQSNPQSYGLDRIDQASLPLDLTYNYTADGSGVTVFVIDTGLNTTHQEFTGRINTTLARTAIDDDNGYEDCNGHGTHVAGTVAGTVSGVAKNATIVPIRVLDCEGTGDSAGVIAGMDFVAANHPARSVVNMSLGGPAGDAKDAAVRNLVSSGVTVVVAAGNESTDACDSSPAREPMAITVASSTSTDARSSFSNFGTCVDIFAPGSNITSAWIGSTTAGKVISGTSMASPHVAGAAALYLSANPNATPAQVTAGLLAATAANKITDVQGSPNKLLQTNFTAAPPPPPPAGAAKITKPADGAQVTPMFEVTVDAMTAAKVELIVDGRVVGTDTTSPFAFAVTGAPEGMHELTARATDAAGQTTSHSIKVTVVASGLGGGGHPVPPPMRYGDDGGCSTSSHGSLALVPAMLLGLVLRRRRIRGMRPSPTHTADNAR